MEFLEYSNMPSFSSQYIGVYGAIRCDYRGRHEPGGSVDSRNHIRYYLVGSQGHQRVETYEMPLHR